MDQNIKRKLGVVQYFDPLTCQGIIDGEDGKLLRFKFSRSASPALTDGMSVSYQESWFEGQAEKVKLI